MTLFGRDVKVFGKHIVKETLDDNVLGLASETAWSFFFGLFPSILFALPIFSLFGNVTEIVESMLTRLEGTVPPETWLMVRNIVMEIIQTNAAPGLMSIGLLLALWSGSSTFGTLTSALNRAYDITETWPWWKVRVLSIACTFAGVIVIAFSTSIFVGGEYIVDLAIRTLHLEAFGAITWTIVQYALALSLVIGFIWMLYLVLPNQRMNRRTTLIGASIATVLWLAFALGFRMYVTNFDAYNKAYGVIGGVMVLMTWMYWTMFVVLVGGEINSAIECGVGTKEGVKPKGQRDACAVS